MTARRAPEKTLVRLVPVSSERGARHGAELGVRHRRRRREDRERLGGPRPHAARHVDRDRAGRGAQRHLHEDLARRQRPGANEHVVAAAGPAGEDDLGWCPRSDRPRIAIVLPGPRPPVRGAAPDALDLARPRAAARRRRRPRSCPPSACAVAAHASAASEASTAPRVAFVPRSPRCRPAEENFLVGTGPASLSPAYGVS